MCIARHTADDCHYTSSGPSQRRLIPPLAEITPQREWLDAPPPSAAGPRSARSCGTPSRIVEEIERLSTSLHRWKEQLSVLPLDEAVAGGLEGGEITVDGKENWERVRLLIPAKASTEVLLEHLVQECDWLVPAGHAPTIWNASLRRGACRAPVAGLMCMHLALSSLLLGSPGNRLYSPQIDWQHLHHQLYNEAQVFVSPDDTSLENLELLVLLSYYQAYSGSSANTSQDWAGMGVVIAREGGWLDESAPVWEHLTAEERQARRRILAELVDLNRWQQLFFLSNPLDDVRLNLCRPAEETIALKAPLDLPGWDSEGHHQLPLRFLRVKSQEECRRTSLYRQLFMDLKDIAPKVRAHHTRLQGNDVPLDISLAQCQDLQQSMLDWREHRLPSHGFSMPRIESIDFTDPLACRNAAQSLTLHDTIIFISTRLLRDWLANDPGDRPVLPAQSALQLACLDNATLAFETIPVVQALAASRFGPFVAAFSAATLFSAATTFAIPVLRAVGTPPVSSLEGEISQLPQWPEHLHPRVYSYAEDRPTDAPGQQLPEHIFLDRKVKQYATNIVVILDALAILNASPLGKSAESRLYQLVEQYGLRGSQAVQPPEPTTQSVVTDWRSGPYKGPGDLQPHALPGNIPATEDGTGGFAVWTESDPFWARLLQLDGSIWDELIME